MGFIVHFLVLLCVQGHLGYLLLSSHWPHQHDGTPWEVSVRADGLRHDPSHVGEMVGFEADGQEGIPKTSLVQNVL